MDCLKLELYKIFTVEEAGNKFHREKEEIG
jgi:hypothetical protein